MLLKTLILRLAIIFFEQIVNVFHCGYSHLSEYYCLDTLVLYNRDLHAENSIQLGFSYGGYFLLLYQATRVTRVMR